MTKAMHKNKRHASFQTVADPDHWTHLIQVFLDSELDLFVAAELEGHDLKDF